MQKKTRDVLMVAGMIIFIIAASIGLSHYLMEQSIVEKTQQKTLTALPDLERLERNIWNSELIYVDRRGEYTLFFVDPDKDGKIDRAVSSLRSYDKENKVSETPLIAFNIAETYYDAENVNRRIFREKILNGEFYLARDSSEAYELQELYNSALAEYRKRHPKSKLPENSDPSTRIRPEMLEKFQLLLSEFRRQDNLGRKAKTQRKFEIAAYKTYLVFFKVREAYTLLNEWEKRYIFKTVKNLPQGFKLDSGPSITALVGVPLTDPRDPRGNFESFLKDSYMETDYMSAWSIAAGDQMGKIQKQYYEELKSRGLKITSDK